MNRLKDTALVSGASKRFGAAIARHLASDESAFRTGKGIVLSGGYR